MESAVAAPARLGSRISGRALRWLLWLAAAVALAVGLRLTVLRPAPRSRSRSSARPRGRVEESVTNSKAGTVKSRRRAELSPEVGGRVRGAPGEKGRACAPGRRPHAHRRRRLPRAGRPPGERARGGARRPARGVPDGGAARPRARAQPGALAREARLGRSGSTSCRAGATRRRRPARRPGRGSARREAALAAARVNLEKTVLRAPFDGVVAEVTTEVGEWITPSPPGLPIPPVLVLLDAGAIYVSAPMDEVDVGKVRAGQPVRVTFDAFPGRSFAGRVTRVAPYVQDVAGAEPHVRDRGGARRRGFRARAAARAPRRTSR